MKTSFITTVFNEEKSIIPFLKSLIDQSVKPSEIVIVDAVSTDKTREIIYDFFSKHKKINYTLIVKKGNRSVGRNIAIKHAKHEIILCSDAGCTLDEHWVEKITEPFIYKNTSVVSGFYKPVTKNVFQKCLAAYTSVPVEKLNPDNFLPSARSIAFKKTAWRKAGGFPENLSTCEDMVFDKRLKEKGEIFITVKDAIVHWPQRENLWQAFVQFFAYAKGDGYAHYFRPQTPTLFLRYVLGIVLLIDAVSLESVILMYLFYLAIIFYIYWSITKNYRFVKRWEALFWLPVLQITADLSVTAGTIVGYLLSTIK